MTSIAIKKEHVSKNDVKTLINLSNSEDKILKTKIQYTIVNGKIEYQAK